MTDYLDELLDNVNALLEQVRRLERSGGVLGQEKDAAAPDSAKSRPEWKKQEEKLRKDARETLEAERSASQSIEAEGKKSAALTGGEAPEPPQRRMTPLEAEQRSFPLLEQVERLERALFGPAASAPAIERGASAWGGWDRERQRYPDARSVQEQTPGYFAAGTGQETEWNTLAHLERLGAGGELAWAEQADRAFRRDSRRYDGGFYLY